MMSIFIFTAWFYFNLIYLFLSYTVLYKCFAFNSGGIYSSLCNKVNVFFFFSIGKNGLACLACGPQLEVVNSLTGERLSAYRFSGVNEQPPVVLAVKEFSWHKRAGLLIGLEEADGSVLCLYDLGISRVVKAVVLPGRVCTI